jgi:Tol biopolymer transport system component
VTLQTGTRLGPYEILSALGAGGMGEVYRARDARLDRSVAIKVLAPHFALDPDLRARFEREARAVAALDHPHVCGIYDVGEGDGTHFIVMPFLEGHTLAARLQKGALPLDQVLTIATEIADALDKAHRQGIVHRDLKPANIMLTKAGSKLLDFGLAKLKTPGGPISMSGMSRFATSAPGTAQGTILGTVQYMAPEQVEGRDADARSDIWALGAVIYEMATGTRPFRGDTPASVIGAILKDVPPSISSLQPLTPAALDRTVSVCLAKDPEDRWQSARDLTRELRWVTQTPGAGLAADAGSRGPAPASRRNRERVAWSIAAALLLTTMAFVLQSAREQPVAAEPVQFVIMPPEGGAFSGDGLAGTNPPGPQLAIAPDGRHLALIASTADGRPRLWVRSLDTIAARALPGTEGAARPFWSPDSGSIGFFAGAKLKTIAATGGPVQVLCDVPSPRGGTWSQDGTIIFAPGFGDALYRVSATGGQPTPATRLDSTRQELSHRWPEFLPDGRHFLFLVINARRDQSGIYLGSLDSPETVRLLDTEFRAAFAQPGYLLFVREGTLLAQPFDAARKRLIGNIVPVAEHVGSGQATGEAPFSTSTTALAYSVSIGSPPTQLTWFDRGGQPRGTIGAPAEYEIPTLSPANHQVAVHRVDPTLGTEVWLMDPTRNNPSRLTFERTINFAPTWSPDGSRIAFSSNRTGTFGLYQKLSSGAGREELLVDTASNGAYPTGWSADGRFLLFTRAGKAGFDVWLLPLFGDRKPYAFSESIANESQARLSGEGRWLAYTSDETGTPEVFVQPFPTTGAKWQVSTGGGFDPQWRRDDREMFYIATDGKMMAVPVNGVSSTFEVAAPQALFQTRTPTMRGPLLFGNYAPAADGQRFLVNTIAVDAPPIPITVVLNWTPALSK